MPRAIAILAVLVLAAPAPLAAQGAAPSPETMRAEIETCLADAAVAGAAQACVGGPSDACIEDGRQTTLGMGECLGAETAAWDAMLNALWSPLRKAEAEADAAEAGSGLPTRAETLLAAQRAWIAYRDAECAYAYARGGAGSIRTLYGASCKLRMTAERVLDFRDWLSGEP